jgi:Flp pilus assembly protein TadG
MVIRNRRRSAVRRLRILIRRFARQRSGLAALEFALILPLMVTLYFGIVEVGDALIVDRKVTSVTSSIADLVAQSKTVTNSDMTNFMKAAKSIIVPYDQSLLKIVVSGISISSKGVATVSWSDAQNATALTTGATVTLPSGVTQASTFIVMAEVHYTYTPTIGYILTGSIDLNDKFYLRPRASTTVARTS